MSTSLYGPEIPDLLYQNSIRCWEPQLCEKRSDVAVDGVHNFLASMYSNRAHCVFTASRDFVRWIKQPRPIAPDDVPAHPHKVAMEVASLTPNSEVTIYPLSLEGLAGEDRPGRRPRAAIPEGARPRRGAVLNEDEARPRALRPRLPSREPHAARKIGAPCGAPVVPPSTTISVPVTFDASSDAR